VLGESLSVATSFSCPDNFLGLKAIFIGIIQNLKNDTGPKYHVKI
jgi:hypothetical protein